MAVGELWSATLDCSAGPLSDFWAAMLGGTIAYTSDDLVGVETPGGVWVRAYRIDDYVPAEWPHGTPGKQFHLDLAGEDLDAAESQAIELGATKAAHQEAPDRWRGLPDPAGRPFCVTTMAA